MSIPDQLSWPVAQALDQAGIEHLYAHQAEALLKAFDGPTVVTTGTASGKSLCFQLPTLEVLTTDRTARALYLYPTKALAQDQARSLHRFGLGKQIRPAIYDGDTPRQERSAIRKRSNLIITNPDMLHVGILPHHAAWGDLFANLAFVVVDEAHVYRGVFGSHVGNVLRRLRRAAAIHGTEPRFLLAVGHDRQPGRPRRDADRPATRSTWSSTMAPRALSAGWPCGTRRCSTRSSGSRASALYEAAEVFSELDPERRPDDLLHEVAQGRGADPQARGRPAPGRAGRAHRPLPRGLHPRPAPRDRAPADDRRAARASWPPTRWSSASTSASSTPRCASPSPAPSPACGRCGAGRAAAAAGWRSTSPARTRWISSSAATPANSSAGRSRRRSSIPPAPRSTPSTCSAPPTRRRSPMTTSRSSDPSGASARSSSTEAGLLRERATGFVPKRADDYPGGTRGAALGLGRQLRPARRQLRRGAGDDRGGARLLDGPRGRGVPAPGPLLPRARRSTSMLGASCSSPSTATTSPRPSARSCSTSSDSRERRVTRGVTLSYGSVVYTETVVGYQRKSLQDHEVIDFQSLDLPTTEFDTRALWYELDELIAAEEFPRGGAAGLAARARARPDRGAAADRDVRPLGHRRPVDRRPSADRRPDDLHLRRPPGRRRDHAPRLSTSSSGSWPTRSVSSGSARASRGARRACSRPSAATSTSRCTSRGRSSCCGA